ncbi:MAG: 2-polyprenyl-6-methoxyphenol hydroxylase-like oxidoreductase [Mojavia pulchra JT2-VF2]|uniref:2-polyprenyl-6-methoxyphenol hydroxylase-like oxidoreductase n=1 Tax=Mojavia pulchra JT2-VF2 TaxID=287848 RepID=A0A951UJT5_9NOST|nr:2-polyprenyl-6-methoxyphenol hydroxylase-like oxidoreductase [Mojavia pulchra JT2-VF2]
MTTVSYGKQAVVIGGSITGLLAARVLLNHFEMVTLVERDRFPQEPRVRPGVPQANQVHVLLTQGQLILEELFPGLKEELTAAGALTVDWIADWMVLGVWGWGQRFASDLKGYTCSRTFLEWVLWQRLAQNKNLQILDMCQVTELLINANKSQVTGVRLSYRAGEDKTTPLLTRDLVANLVVDATGRNSAMSDWLVALGYPSPPVTIVNSFLGYASRWYQRPKEFQADWQGATVMSKPPETGRGGVLYPVEGNRWVVTLGGIGRDYPPTEEAGFLEFARSLRSPIIYEAIKDAQPLSPVYSYRRTENRRCHYEKSLLPEGVLVMGDAVCAFNPVYGQGITVAAMEALLLDKCLQKKLNSNQNSLVGLTRRFQHQLAKTIATPWLMATGEDLRWPTTVGGKPDPISKITQHYFDQVLKLMIDAPDVYRKFAAVVHMVEPPTVLFQPSIVARILWQIIRAWSKSN